MSINGLWPIYIRMQVVLILLANMVPLPASTRYLKAHTPMPEGSHPASVKACLWSFKALGMLCPSPWPQNIKRKDTCSNNILFMFLLQVPQVLELIICPVGSLPVCAFCLLSTSSAQVLHPPSSTNQSDFSNLSISKLSLSSSNKELSEGSPCRRNSGPTGKSGCWYDWCLDMCFPMRGTWEATLWDSCS